jgi:hypothetical protein
MDTIPFFEYLAFLLLFIGSFSILRIQSIKIIGFSFLFIVNAFFLLYFGSKFFDKNGYFTINTISNLASFSIIDSGTLYFVSFILVLMMLHYFHVNYTQATGSSYSRIPEPFYTQLEVFESNTLSSFVISVIILSLLLSQYTYSLIAPGNYKIWFAKNKPTSVWYDLYIPWYAIIEVILSITLVTISTNQIIVANGFQKLTRQEILPTNPATQ